MNNYPLLCEYQPNPLGIDVRRPRLSWKLQADCRGAYQTAYRIVAAEDIASVEDRLNLLWDSGVVESSASNLVPYSGPALRSRQRVYWCVQSRDKVGDWGPWSQPAWFEMGLLDPADWQASWIASDLVGDKRSGAPCPFFRKPFTLSGDIASARLYITALGLYEVYLNGYQVGEDVFTPGWTDYHKQVKYQTYDIARFLAQGENVIGAILGDGWYCGHVAWEGRQNYGDRPRLLAQLEIRLADGTIQTITTDETWTTAPGPILESDLIMGEDYDARREYQDWSKVSFLGQGEGAMAGWSPVISFPHPSHLVLTAQYAPAIRVQGEINPICDPLRAAADGEGWIFDFSQNIVGRVRLRVRGKPGQKVTMRFGEMLTEQGQLYTDNLRAARQTDTYTLKGDPEGESYESHFTFHGFRYVQVEGLNHPPTRDLLTGIVLHSDNSPSLDFETSHALLNKLQHNITWGWKGNSLDVPTDCPQRDERLGWTGDAQVFARTAAYLSHSAAFFSKWVQDLADAQFDYGAIPPYAPFVSSSRKGDGGPAWSDAFIIVPWTIWQHYGDSRILEAHYDAMCAYLDYLVTNSPGLIRLLPDEKELEPGDEESTGGFGDWLAQDGSDDRRGCTPRDLIGTAFLAYDAALMAQIAAALGKNDDASRFFELFEKTRSAFQERFLHPDGSVKGGTQTAYILALHFDLIPDHLRQATFALLVGDIEARGRHMSTGFVGTPYLLQVLSEGGRPDLAYALLLQHSYPSWLYAVLHGATTIWERWDGWTEENGFQDPGMNSFNHYAYGAVGAWMVETIGGIRPDPAAPGFKHFFLQPVFPPASLEGREDEINQANAAYESPYGKIRSHWLKEPQGLTWEVVVPANTTATARISLQEGQEIFEGSDSVAEAVGVTCLGQVQDALVLSLQPGSYRFTRKERPISSDSPPD